MSSPQLQTVLWVVQPVLSLVLATAMYRRGINKVFPVFFAYTMTQIGMFTVQKRGTIPPAAWASSYFVFIE